MADLASDSPAAAPRPGSLAAGSPRLRKRRRAELRLKIYGISAIGIAAAALEVAQATELFAVLIELLDRPTGPYRRGQFFQRGLRWKIAEVVLRLSLAIPIGQALGNEPALLACLCAVIIEATRLVALSPMHPNCEEPSAHRSFAAFAPSNGLPRLFRQLRNHFVHPV